jgi:hypothetical protein
MISSYYSTDFCSFIAKTCIFLFFHVPSSKSRSLLITTASLRRQKNKPSQTNFDSNVAIRTFDREPPAPQNKPSQTILPLSSPLHQRACEGYGGGVLSLRATEKGLGGGVCAADTAFTHHSLLITV